MTPGTTISHYRIVSQLGRGGMGIVYRAEDTKLDRTVALKLLPPHALVSEDDKARFYREARAAAALNHPNIAHVYEIDEAMAEGESRPFIAMEYIDGETLADRVAKGPLPVKDAISIATQIAEGLKTAHRKDVVHRDVKSGNVMITKDGVVKVLDFGLAKTAASTKLTQIGSTLGTVAYMSPEQARGEDVDRRSDVWSLGVILYEMITGRLPFRGDYEQAVVYGILNEDPESMTTLRAGVPLALDGIVAKLLAKDPDLRYQNVDELPADLKRVDLETTATLSRLSTTGVGRQATSMPTIGRGDRARSWVLSAGIAVVSLVLGFLLAWILRASEVEPAKRYTVSLDPYELGEWPSISGDGSIFAFQSGSPPRAYVKTPAGFQPRFVPYVEGGPILSPNGEWIAFYADGSWKRVPVEGGGRPLELLDPGELIGWADWKTEELIAISTSEGIVELDVSTGAQTPLTRPDSGSYHIFPQYVGSRGLLVTEIWPSNLDSSLVKAVNLETEDISVVDPRPRMARYLESGHLLYSEASWVQPGSEWTLWVAPFGRETMRMHGTPVPVLEGASFASVVVSDNGRVIWGAGKVVGGTSISPRRILSVGLDGSESLFAEQQKVYRGVAFSRTGRQVAVTVGPNDSAWGDSEIWIYDVDSGIGSQLTFGHWSGYPVWLPDGEHVVYYSDRDTSTTTVWVQRADGSESAAAFIQSRAKLHPSSVHRDGRVLATGEGEGRIILMNGSAGTEEVVLKVDGATLGRARFSPDGNWIAYQSDELGRYEVFVTAFPTSGARWRVSTEGGFWPLWSPDGKLIYYRSEQGSVMAATVSTETGFERIGAPEVLFERSGFVGWDIHPSGDTFLAVARGVLDSERSSNVYVIENWFEELKRIAPTGD